MEDIHRSQYRLPGALYEKLKKAVARRSGGSINGEIVDRLEASFENTLEEIPTGDLITELLRRYKPEQIYIRIGVPDRTQGER